MMDTSTLRLLRWMRGRALPLWAGLQEPAGGWPEHLFPDGRPDSAAPRRHRVQARQIYAFALATRRGWYAGEDVVRRGVDFLWEAGRADAPALVHLLRSDGDVIDARRDLYDHAFYLLALGWAEATVGGQGARIEELVAFIDTLALPEGGYSEAATLRGGVDRRAARGAERRRQNPHMHLLEAYLNLHELGVPGEWMARARAIVELFDAHFFDAEVGGVREFFGADWRWDKGSLEPGHAMEWVWLLAEWERLGGEARHGARARLYGQALIHSGVWLWDEVDHDHVAVRETSRLWVQTELLKAHIAQARLGVAGAQEMAAAGMDGLMAEWLEPRGTWIDQRGACGQTVATTIPTSTFYHIATLVAAADHAIR